MYDTVPRRVLLQKTADRRIATIPAKKVLHRGITAEFSSIEDILEKAKDIKDSSWYDIGSRNANDGNDTITTVYKPAVRTSKPMFYPAYKLLLFEKWAHICSPHDDRSGTKGPGLSGGAYMLIILSIPVVIMFTSLLVLSRLYWDSGPSPLASS